MITWFLVGVVSAFPVWFSLGWITRRDEHRQLAWQRGARCVCGCPGPRSGPRPVPVTALAARVGELPTAKGGAR